MKNNYFVFSAILFFFVILSSGCTKSSDNIAIPSENTATISVNTDSEYVKTFKDLGLGILYDFDFRLPDADKRWVTIWVEGYTDGEKEPDPLTELSYGLSPNQVTKGNIGFGIINPNTGDPLIFLYAPGVSIPPHKIGNIISSNGLSAWDYAIGDEKVGLKLGETKLLGVFRQSSDNSMRTFDFQDEDDVEQMINEDSKVLLLKIKIEESNE